ncbi:glutamyl-tRNA(Gln) amidotransferase subunit A, partial [Dehalococcoides mccartyi]
MTDLVKLTIAQSHKLLKDRKISSAELTKAHLERIEKLEPEIKAFMTVCPETALSQAEAADKAIKQGDIRPLTGIPMALKDVLCTKGIRTTCSSKMLENFVPPYNAHVVDKLAKEGAVLLGKTNMDEFAMGSSTENSAYFTTRNPWNTDKVPGGSSGGSAACVAASEAVFSLGPDRFEHLVEQLLTQRQPLALVVQLLESSHDALFRRRHLHRLHRAEELADEAGHRAGGLPAGAAVALDAAGGQVGDDADDQQRRQGQQGDLRADVQHQDQGDDDDAQAGQDIVDPDDEERDLGHIVAEAADRLAGGIGQRRGSRAAQDVAQQILAQQGRDVGEDRHVGVVETVAA